MHLRLSLPPRADGPGNPEIQTDPAAVSRWLTNLPILNVGDTSQQLISQLTGLNRMALDDKLRFKLLELFRLPIKQVSQEFQKLYIGQPLPLQEKQRLATSQVRQLQTEMAYGYKLIAFNSTALAKNEHIDKAMMSIVLHRAIRHLTDTLFRNYELYNAPPEGCWYEIHQLYRYAEILGITETPLKDPLNNTLPLVSISHAYRQALLLDFSDPYHLPALLLARIYRYLDRWAGLAQLSPGVASLKSQCQFLINLDNDRAGAVNTESSPITTEVRYRLLNTTELARVIHQQLMILQSGQTPDPEGLEKDFFTHLGQDMLLRLINAWGVNPKRVFTRSLRDNRLTDVVIGLESVNFMVNGEVPFSPSSSEIGPQPRRTAIQHANGTTNKVKPAASASASSTVWELTDESAGGYSLAKTGAHDESVRVGDLLASRRHGDSGDWEIGVVRWVRTTAPESIELGVQRLAPAAKAVSVMPLEGEQDNYFLALALPEIRAMKQPATLLTSRGFFKPKRILYLDSSYNTRQIRATKLVELSGAFERFQYEVIEA